MRHFLAHTVCEGRHTVTELLRSLGRHGRDWKADYQLYSSQLQADMLFAPILKEIESMLEKRAPLVLAVDDSMMGKTGRKIPGAGWQRDALSPPFHTNLKLGLRFVQISAAVWPKGKPQEFRMIPVAFKVVPKIPRLPKQATPGQQQAHRELCHLNSVSTHTLALLKLIRRHMVEPDRMIHLIGDGGFTTSTLLQNLPRKVLYIGRGRTDMHLCDVPPPKTGRRGRPLSYGNKLPTPLELKQDPTVSWSTCTVRKRNSIITLRYKHLPRVTWRTAGEKRIGQVLVIAPFRYKKTKHGPWLYTRPTYLYCSRSRLGVTRIIETYFMRWDIEVNFKEQRQVFGMHHAQVRHARSISTAPALAVSAYASLHIAAIKAFGFQNTPPAVSVPKWRRSKPPHRFSTLDLIRQIRFETVLKLINFSRLAKPVKTTRTRRNSFFPHHAVP